MNHLWKERKSLYLLSVLLPVRLHWSARADTQLTSVKHRSWCVSVAAFTNSTPRCGKFNFQSSGWQLLLLSAFRLESSQWADAEPWPSPYKGTLAVVQTTSLCSTFVRCLICLSSTWQFSVAFLVIPFVWCFHAVACNFTMFFPHKPRWVNTFPFAPHWVENPPLSRSLGIKRSHCVGGRLRAQLYRL